MTDPAQPAPPQPAPPQPPPPPPPAAPSTGQTPAVVTINGQPLDLGEGLVRLMVDTVRAAHAPGSGTMPVVTVNGQVVPLGQPAGSTPVPASYLDPGRLAAVRQAIGQLMDGHPEQAQHLQGILGLAGETPGAAGAASGGGTAGVPYGPPQTASWTSPAIAPTAYPSPLTVAPLADPPRPVPMSYRLATFQLSAIEIFLLFLGSVAPIAVWILVPAARPVALLVASALVVAFRARRYRRLIPLLRWGKVATVTGVEPLGSHTSYSNVRLRHARGWQADTRWYSGSGHTTRLTYTLDGQQGSLKVRGIDYDGGVVLADSRRPQRARCVSQIPYDVVPTADGQWPGGLSAWLWGGVVSTLLIELTLFYVTALTVFRAWVR